MACGKLFIEIQRRPSLTSAIVTHLVTKTRVFELTLCAQTGQSRVGDLDNRE